MTRFSACSRRRRLIVDTDLGLDDLVALAILRLQQCIVSQRSSNHDLESNLSTHHHHKQHTNFHLCGVTLTSGISISNHKNASLLRRLLPPDTPVYVGETCRNTLLDNDHKEKPIWWTRTADRVENFLSSLPAKGEVQQNQDVSTEQFLANNFNDPDVDILCMGPLTNISKSLDLFAKQNPDSCIKSKFYVMGGIRNDSKLTKRGESTAPFGYCDKFSGNEQTANPEANQCSRQYAIDQFGEFNFALDIESAKKVLSTVAAHIITLEACTLVPAHLRHEKLEMNLSTILAQSDEVTLYEQQVDTASELRNARTVLLRLLHKFGTDETQWDSIAAAIYCNVFVCDEDLKISPSELSLSDLGVCYFPGQMQIAYDDGKDSDGDNAARDHATASHQIHRAFTVNDELVFYEFLSSILFDKEANEYA